ncbi:hypothetical protein E2C01_005749 [Portunus trituberculatus]|uniref:Uncharacterized protein n=1 Tax=Portunus trituberculatus TaxID=210409 RepID=A0A5B7CVV1_PORTR|nr:hypothetical protein [Portunus trituberculatus]
MASKIAEESPADYHSRYQRCHQPPPCLVPAGGVRREPASLIVPQIHFGTCCTQPTLHTPSHGKCLSSYLSVCPLFCLLFHLSVSLFFSVYLLSVRPFVCRFACLQREYVIRWTTSNALTMFRLMTACDPGDPRRPQPP